MDPDGTDMFFDDGGAGGFDTVTGGGFDVGIGLFVFLFVVVAVVGVAMALRRGKKLHDAGIDLLDPETDLQVRWAKSRAAAPAAAPTADAQRSVAERLAEVDRLYADRTIDEAEHAAARARILGSL